MTSSSAPPEASAASLRDEMALYTQTTRRMSRLMTLSYSTSFSIGTRLLAPRFRKHIYAIYGFVRMGDEIVDTFHDWDKETLLARFCADTHEAIDAKLSLNPVLHAFQHTVRRCSIARTHIDAFLHSMKMDISMRTHDAESYARYIRGSAEAVGLMALHVFCGRDQARYEALHPHALALGAAFQKVNFLRDLRSDYLERGRVYFPDVSFEQFSAAQKKAIEADITQDFRQAYLGVLKLPAGSRLGVYVAYSYFHRLLRYIQRASAEDLQGRRLRLPNRVKLWLVLQAWCRLSFRSCFAARP